MITNLVIFVIVSIISTVFLILPAVSIASIPSIGPAVSSALITAVGIWNSFIVSFPYAGIAWNVFLIVILPFELLLLLAKFFLGSRVPAHTN